MLEKIDFKNGVVLSSKILNELENATVFNPRYPREGYYSAPTTTDNAFWYIGERDGIKDWEFADPSIEPNTNMGRLAYDGIILGCKNCDLDSIEPLEVEIGPPRVTYRDLGSSPLGLEEDLSPKIGLIVNAGSFINSRGTPLSWTTNIVVVDPGVPQYIYIEYNLQNELELMAAPALPNQTEYVVPLAKVTVNALGVDETEPDRIEYVDLRPGVYIFSDTKLELKNTDPILDDQTLVSWERAVVDTANGSINLTLPSDPVNGDRLAVYDLSGTFDIFPVRVYVATSTLDESPLHTILDGKTSIELMEKYSHNTFIYYEPTQQWILEQPPKNIENREQKGEFVACGGRECIGIIPANQCITGESIPPTFPQPSEGFYEYDSISGKCYKIINESIGVYADGDGEFTKIFFDARCGRLPEAVISDDRKTIYVDINSGDDSILNTGLIESKPFRTLERALLESAKRDKPYTIKLSAGDYYIDNSVGANSNLAPTTDRGYHNLVEIDGYTVGRFDIQTKKLTIIGENQSESVPPIGLELGRTVYGRGGAFGTIISIEKPQGVCHKDCGWKFKLNGVVGTFVTNERLYYNDLSVVNSIDGGLIVPNGTSIIGSDLRGTVLRPLYVPTPEDSEGTGVLKLTSNSYITRVTFSDNKQYQRTHSGLTTIVFASEADILGSDTDPLIYSYYKKAGALLSIDDLESVAALELDTDIVSKSGPDFGSRFEDTIENQTGEPRADYDPDRIDFSIKYPGAISSLGVAVPDVNSVNKGSPYVQNCSVKSMFGLNGMHADGSLVGGFKSMLASNFTIVSLQVDPDAYLDGDISIENDPTNTDAPKEYKPTHRHYGFKASKEGYIQANSIYTVGAADHVYSIDGGEITITGSTANFGDVSLKSDGYFPRSYSQDYATTATGYDGTRLTEIIPPKPVEDYSEEVKVDTGLNFVFDPSRVHAELLEGTLSDSTTYRLYVKSADNLVVYDEDTPPTAKQMGAFSYTYLDGNGGYQLAGKNNDHNSISIDGTDGVRYTALINIANSQANTLTDNRSKVFLWDENPPKEIIKEIGNFTVEEDFRDIITFQGDETEADFLRIGNFLQITTAVYEVLSISENTADPQNTIYEVTLNKPIPGTALTGYADAVSNNIETGLWYIEVKGYSTSTSILRQLREKSTRLTELRPLAILRDIDKRAYEERIYRVKLEGYLPGRGLRKPPEGYILVKQPDLDPYDQFNDGLEPLVITNVTPVEGSIGTYTAALVFASDVLDAYTYKLYPTANIDNLAVPKEPDLTRLAITEPNGLLARGVEIDSDPDPAETPYAVSDSSGADLRIELRRPSTIRASAHTWEWVGYLNYESGLPKYRGPEFSEADYILKISTELNGGRVYSAGMDHNGLTYLNGVAQVVAPEYPTESLSDTRFLPTERPTDSLYINRELYMSVGSDLVFDGGTQIHFKGGLELLDVDGTVINSRSNTVAGLLATDSIAGLSQRATSDSLDKTLRDQSLSPPDQELAVTTDFITPVLLRESLASPTKYGLVKLTNTLEEDDEELAVTSQAVLSRVASSSSVGVVKITNSVLDLAHEDYQTSALTSKAFTDRTATTSRTGIVKLANDLITPEDISTNATDAVTPQAVLALTASTEMAGIIKKVTQLDIKEGAPPTYRALSAYEQGAVTPTALGTLLGDTERAGLVQLVDNINDPNAVPGVSTLAVTPQAVYDYIDFAVDTASIRTINNVRLSHTLNAPGLSSTYPGGNNNTAIYLWPEGGNLALRDPSTSNWRVYAVTSDRTFNLADISLIGGGALSSSTLYYLYYYADSAGKINIAASTSAPVPVDGVYGLSSLQKKYRYAGKLQTSSSLTISYSQIQGGRLLLNGKSATDATEISAPQINLVNFENRIPVSLKYLFKEAMPQQVSPESALGYTVPVDHPGVRVLTTENSIVRGRLTAINYYVLNSPYSGVTSPLLAVFPEISTTKGSGDTYHPLNENTTYHTMGLTSGQRTVTQSDFEYATDFAAEVITVKYATKYWGVVGDGALLSDVASITINDGAQSTYSFANVGMLIETEI